MLREFGYKVRFWEPIKDYNQNRDEYLGAIDTVLSEGDFIMGEELEKFEKGFAEYLGVRHVIGLNSGTDALMMALIAAGVGPGDEVITVSNTFIATIQVIHHLGATPILVDVGEDGLMDMELVERAITDKTKAIIPVHLSGDMCEVAPLMAMRAGRDVKIIEDAAQAIGSEREGFKAGSWGFAGCFSFYPAKVLGTFGDAGAMVTNDDAVAERVRKLRDHSLIGKVHDTDASIEFGYNSRLDNAWAAILNIKLAKLPWYLEKRKEVAEYYNEQLKDLPITLPVNRDGRIWQDYVIRSDKRNELAAFLDSEGIKVRGHDLQPNHAYKALGLDFNLPVTDKIVNTSIRLPIHPYMTEHDMGLVTDAIKKFYA